MCFILTYTCCHRKRSGNVLCKSGWPFFFLLSNTWPTTLVIFRELLVQQNVAKQFSRWFANQHVWKFVGCFVNQHLCNFGLFRKSTLVGLCWFDTMVDSPQQIYDGSEMVSCEYRTHSISNWLSINTWSFVYNFIWQLQWVFPNSTVAMHNGELTW